MKRIFDIIISIIALIFLSPLLIVISILVRIKLGSPIFFLQQRPGLNEKLFKIIKFRTMELKKDTHGELLPDEDRKNFFGDWLRKYSLDELPQLINVISGNMSLVGPRPLLIEYLDLYDHKQKRRHNVLPGITGWSQINGRNAINWKEKLSLDIWYVDNQSFILDLKIILLTIKKLFKKENITPKDLNFMPKFKGKNIE